MEPSYDNEGFLLRVLGKFAYGRSVSLTKWNDKIYLHINDKSKCWINGKFDKTKEKSVSIKWDDAVTLKDLLIQLGPYAEQIEAEQVTSFRMFFFLL